MEAQESASISYKAFKTCHSLKRRQNWLGRHLRSRQQAWQGRCSRSRDPSCSAQNQQQGTKEKVVILGGTGRVGSSTAVALLKKDSSLDVVVGSRERSSYDRAVKKRPKLADARFEKVCPLFAEYLKFPHKTDSKPICSTGSCSNFWPTLNTNLRSYMFRCR